MVSNGIYYKYQNIGISWPMNTWNVIHIYILNYRPLLTYIFICICCCLSIRTESLAYIYIRNHWLDIATTSDIKLKFDIICLSNTCLSVTCLDKFANKGFLTVGTLEVILVCFMDFLHVSLFAWILFERFLALCALVVCLFMDFLYMSISMALLFKAFLTDVTFKVCEEQWMTFQDVSV